MASHDHTSECIACGCRARSLGKGCGCQQCGHARPHTSATGSDRAADRLHSQLPTTAEFKEFGSNLWYAVRVLLIIAACLLVLGGLGALFPPLVPIFGIGGAIVVILFKVAGAVWE